MWLGSLKAKRKILTAPLAGLNLISRWLVRFVLFTFGTLISVEHPRRMTACPWPFIVALNHNNYAETILAPATLIFLCGGKKISFLVHWMFQFVPVLNRVLKQINPVWVYNRKTHWRWLNRLKPVTQQDIFQEARERLGQGLSLGIFPEGGRNNNPFTLKRGRMGIGRLVLEAGVPVLPVGIYYPAKDKRKKIPAIGKMALRIGNPLYFTAELKEFRAWTARKPGGQNGSRERIFKSYSAIAHKIMREISALCGKEYPY